MPEIGKNLYLGDKLVPLIYIGNDNAAVSPFSTPAFLNVVTDGLLIWYDSQIYESYPGTGTNWYNLVSGQNYTGSLESNVTYTNSYLETKTGANGYIDLNAPNWATGQNYTVMTAIRYVTNSGRMLAGKNNNWLLGNYIGYPENHYAEGWVYQTLGGYDTNWRIFTGTRDNATNIYEFYLNNSLLASNTNGNEGFNGLRIGIANNGTETGNGQVAFVLIYNRVLTSTEITQNYNALKSKVGL